VGGRGAGVAGDERKQHLSVFPSVSVACNPSFINSFISCDFGGRGKAFVVSNYPRQETLIDGKVINA